MGGDTSVGGAGGGGRIAIYYSVNNFIGDIIVNGGSGYRTCDGEDGTLYLKNTSIPYIKFIYPDAGTFINDNVLLQYESYDDKDDSEQLSVTDANGNPPPFSYTEEGIHNIVLFITDTDGNTGDFPISFTIDKTMPEISITEPAEGMEITRPVEIYSTASDKYGIRNVEYYANGEFIGENSAAPYEIFWDILNITDGRYELKAVAEDAAGNRASSIKTVDVICAPPDKPVITEPSAGITINYNEINVKGIADYGTDIALYINENYRKSVSASEGAFLFSKINLFEGKNKISAIASHRGGSAASEPVWITVDTGAPDPVDTLSVLSYKNGEVFLEWEYPASGEKPEVFELYRSNSEINRDNLDTLSSITATADLSYSDFPGEDGLYYYAVVGIDEAGNRSEISNCVSSLSDSRGPAASIEPPLGEIGPGVYSFELVLGEIPARVPVVRYIPSGSSPILIEELNAIEPKLYRGEVNIASAAPSGPAEFTYQSEDYVGNISREISSGAQFIIDTEPPAVDISMQSPVSTGIYTAQIYTDEALAGTPTVSCISASGNDIKVADSRKMENLLWEINLEILKTTGDGKAEFVFIGEDLYGNRGGTIKSGDSFIIDTTAPPAPADFTAKSEKDGAVSLSWSLAGDAESGDLYRNGELIKSAITSGNYTDVPQSDGIYDYSVTAEDVAGNRSQPAKATGVSDSLPPEPPENLNYELTQQAVSLYWSASPGAESYTAH
ncbi:MAG: Ig-like domain-containing protein, partial [Elusimicrobiota bacterium]|nr:Ig-like domain-containing protein [Elusimicrobiota bacterium]